jgi:SAM-dependent methyltransferase
MKSNKIAGTLVKQGILSPIEILAGYDAVSELYPNVPSLLLWRAWEYAAYQRFALSEPVLDVGCGDGRYFQLVWPQIRDVVGVDMEPNVAEMAMRSGVYRSVYVAPAHQIPTENETFASAFANCSLEHMDYLSNVLEDIYRSLRPGASFLLSVVTDSLIEWNALPLAIARLGDIDRARVLQNDYQEYHHYVNPFSPKVWIKHLEEAGFDVLEHIPILPEVTSRLFTFIDTLWHVKQPDGELGDSIHTYLENLHRFPDGFRRVLAGILQMEMDWTIGSGAVLLARKKLDNSKEVFDQPLITDQKVRPGLTGTPPCWCDNNDWEFFTLQYVKCKACGSLRMSEISSSADYTSVEGSRDICVPSQSFDEQEDRQELPSIADHSRAELPESDLRLVRTLLQYAPLAGRVLELDSGHGGRVALMRWAGFDGSGLEGNIQLAEQARRIFDVPISCSLIEETYIAAGSLDAIVMLNVLEYLPDPTGTLRRCLEILKTSGILIIQTPQLPETANYDEMLASKSVFLDFFQYGGYRYLFSRQSIRKFFDRIGASYIQFVPAISGKYNMFCIVSRVPLTLRSADEIAHALSMSPNGRMVLALLDLDNQRRALQHQHAELKNHHAVVEADRAARLEVIEHQGAELGRVSALEADIAHLREQVAANELHLAAAEADRVARLEVIERQGAELGRIPALEADVAYLKAQVVASVQQLAASEADRAARLQVIEHQGGELGLLRQRFAHVEQRVKAAGQLLSDSRTGALLRAVRPAWWRHFQASLAEVATLSHLNGWQQPSSTQNADHELNDYIAGIDRFNDGQPNTELLNAIRAYNHNMVDELNKLRPLRGKRLLDIGASPHGYALERALQCGVAEYIGIGLDVKEPLEVRAGSVAGRLLAMDATHLDFEDASLDLIISLSTFEHIDDVAAALREIKRVLKPGGSALISFEPLWTCSYGHHLHHFGAVSKLMPDWAHLIWDKQQMLRELAPIWPADAPLTLGDAAYWVYESIAINRIGITQMREFFAQCGLLIDWIAPIPDATRDSERLHMVAAAISLSPDDLMTKGLSVLLNKGPATSPNGETA